MQRWDFYFLNIITKEKLSYPRIIDSYQISGFVIIWCVPIKFVCAVIDLKEWSAPPLIINVDVLAEHF